MKIKSIVNHLILGSLITVSLLNNVYADTHKKAKHIKTSKAKKTVQAPEASIKGIQYICADKQSFYIDGIIESDNNINLYYNKSNIILSRIDTETGVSRFTNIDKGFDLIAMPSKIMLMNTKIGRRIADECNTNMQVVPNMQPTQ